MRILSAILMITALGAAGCDRLTGQQDRHPELVWSGRLAQLDGAPVGSTGINLDIYRDPGSTDGELRYEFGNGCIGGGRVSRDGSVGAHEILRPCLAEDLSRLRRLINITGPGLPSPASEQRLTWTAASAELTSSEGNARFVTTR